MKTNRPLFTLVAIWSDGLLFPLTGPQAQACEYGLLMGLAAMRRQCHRSDSWKRRVENLVRDRNGTFTVGAPE